MRAKKGSMVLVINHEVNGIGNILKVTGHCQCGCKGYSCSNRKDYYPGDVKVLKAR